MIEVKKFKAEEHLPSLDNVLKAVKEEPKARRYSGNKNRIELLPDRPLELIAEVYTKGAHKHTIYLDKEGNKIPGKDIPFEDRGKYEIYENGDDNWRKGLSWRATTGSLLRHVLAYRNGEDFDPELLTYHLANAGWNIFTLLEQYHTHPELDDRPHKYLKHPKIGIDIDGVIADFNGHLMTVSGNKGHIPKYWNCPIVRKEFEKYKAEEDFWRDFPPLIDGNDIPFEPHCYITARSVNPEITQEWLDKHGFPHAKLYCVGIGESKIDIAKKSGIQWFIDDSYSNFVELNKAGICCFLYSAPHNERYDVGYKRIKDFKDFKGRFL